MDTKNREGGLVRRHIPEEWRYPWPPEIHDWQRKMRQDRRWKRSWEIWGGQGVEDGEGREMRGERRDEEGLGL
jgi:hypothetical protein